MLAPIGSSGGSGRLDTNPVTPPALRRHHPLSLIARPENLAADRIDRRLAENQFGKRKVVFVIRERDGRALPQVFASEDAAVSFIRSRIAKGTVVHADESPAWNSLHAKFLMKRVTHQAVVGPQ